MSDFKLIEKMQNMIEDNFTRDIIIPLFKKLNYNVKFNGGAYEKGKDAICWKEDEFGEIEFTVIQTKMKKVTANSSGNNSMSTVVNQLIEATSNLIEHTDGLKYRPKSVFFVCPQDIELKPLQQRFDELSMMKYKIKLLDLQKLTNAFTKYGMWEDIGKLFNHEHENIDQLLAENVENKELYNALGYDSDIDASLYYSDLDISYLDSVLKIRKNEESPYILLRDDEYKKFKDFILNHSTTLSLLHRIINFNEIENNHKISNSKENLEKVSLIQNTIIKIEKLKGEIKQRYFEYKSIEDKDIRFIKLIKIEMNKFNNLYEFFTKLKNSKKTVDYKYEYNTKSIGDFIKLFGDDDSGEITLLDDILDNLIKFEKNLIELINIKKSTIEITDFFIDINIIKLNRYLNKILIGINKNIINNEAFIVTIKEIIEFKNVIHELDSLVPSLDFSFVKSKSIKNYKVNHHVSNLLNEKISIVLEANAGSGKTTTLEHFSKNGNSGLVKVFLPLTKIINLINKIEELHSYVDRETKFFDAICMYFSNKSKTIVFDNSKLLELFNNKNSIFLFDGFDEVSGVAPWIIDIIEKLKDKYKVTIAISSRPEYIKSLKKDFLFIKLMDFNDSQRNKFIDAWFKQDISSSEELKKHIKTNNIEDLISNPLAATIFCRLIEKKYPLPVTETDMYNNRLDLLLGEYDNHKKVYRNNIGKYELEKFAKKIAYIFHKYNNRNMTKKEILFYLQYEYPYYEEQTIENILNELITPCNILFDEFNDTKYTFGHLRYQEHLVARELQNNRGINILDYLKNPWWRGALILFSQLTDNIKYIVEDIITKDNDVHSYISILEDMIAVRPDRNEQEKLLELINVYKTKDYLDYTEGF